MASTRHVLPTALVAVLLFAATASAQPCAPGWDARFAERGADNSVWTLLEFDDGTGPALYAGGTFATFEGARAWGLAKWDGRHWTEVGGGVSRNGGPGVVLALGVWSDGSGPALYVGGSFDHAGNVAAANVARWDGREWSALGAGTDDNPWSFGVYDDGRGDALYVGGEFRSAGGVAAEHIARWNGETWEPLGSGLVGGTFGATTMVVFEDALGPALFVGGGFDYAGSQPIPYLARWDGHEWSRLDGMVLERRSSFWAPNVDQLVVWNDGAGDALYAVGEFRVVNGPECIVRWDGLSWSALPGLSFGGPGDGIAVHDDGTGTALWIGCDGVLRIEEPQQYSSLAKWDGQNWSAPPSYPDPWVFTLASFNDGFGSALYVGGWLDWMRPETTRINNVVRWTSPHMALQHTPLRGGERALFSTTCSTPGRRVYFTYSTTGLGSFYVPQLNVTLDLDRPHLAGFDVADQDGKAELVRTLPPNSSGRTLHLQAAEQGRKSEVVEALIE